MSKPNSFIESCGRRILWIVLASAFLLVVGLSHVALSQENGAEKDRIIHQIVQNYLQIGTEQYGKGYFDEAEKTFIMAEGYQQYLTATERQQLENLLGRTRTAVSERKRIVETYQTVIELLAQDELVKAKSHLEKIKDSKFLTKQEAEQIAEALRQIGTRIGEAEPVTEKVIEEGEAVAEEPDEVRPKVAPGKKEAEEKRKQIIDLYNSSAKLYRAGELEKAREGFVEVIKSGLIPVAMAKTLKGYVERIDKTLDEEAKPSAGGEGVDKRKQTAELYKRSVELYNKGAFGRAREGFTKVAQSGLLTAAGEKNVSDYLRRIEKLSGERAVRPVPERAVPKVEKVPRAVAKPEEVVPEIPEIGETVTGEEAYIDVVNRKRNIVRSHARAVVNDAIANARSFMEKGEFDKAKEVAANAEVTVTTNQMYLGEELFKQYASTLTSLREQIVKAENEKAQKGEQEKRTAAAESQRKFKEQMESDREKRKAELMKNALTYQQQERYEAALGQLESLLALDPQDSEALVLKQKLEDTIYFKSQLEVKKKTDKQRADILLGAEESAIPYADELTYPKNWREITQKRRPEEPRVLNPADAAVYEQLSKIVDLSGLQQQMSLSEAIDLIKNTVQPPLQIDSVWRDLESVGILRTTPINMDGLPSVRLGDALERLLVAVAGRAGLVDYAVKGGVITIATVESLPKRETRVYDVSDLVAVPSNYWTGFVMGAGMGMSSYYGYGGYSGGYGGGMGGGMGGGGMGGYGGGMGGGGMGGYGGGMGGGGMGGYGGGGGGMMGGGGMDTYVQTERARDLGLLVEQTIGMPEDWAPDYWTGFDGTGYGTITPYPSQQPKKLAIYQTPEMHRLIKDLLDQLRKGLGHQVAIEARFLVVSENFLEDIGLDVDLLAYRRLGGAWGDLTFAQGSSGAVQPGKTKVPGTLGGDVINPALTAGTSYGNAVLDDLQVEFVLRATQGRSDAATLTAPTATVVSGETANFSISDYTWYVVPATTVRTLIPSWPTGQTEFTQPVQPQQVSTGTFLTITPTIMQDKRNVLLNISASLSELLERRQYTVATVVNNTIQDLPFILPDTEISQIVTRVSVPDGGTLLLGGQKITANVEREVGVPVLSKIPILGRLFGNRSKIKDQRILLILVKPTIILQEEREIAAMEAGS